MKQYSYATIAALLAVGITTTMDFTGYTMFSALPLFGLSLLFWILKKHSKTSLGLQWGKIQDYGLAVLYPIAVLGVLSLIASLAGAVDLSNKNWSNIALNMGIGSTMGTLVVLLTEEGFFRGWLWADIHASNKKIISVLIWTSAVFTIWHISAVTADSDYGLPLKQVPIYLVNVFLLGTIWGLMRILSGSVIVASVSHAVWNALAYAMFGYGENVGALGISNTALFGPEVGILGILGNGLFLLWIWRKYKKKAVITTT